MIMAPPTLDLVFNHTIHSIVAGAILISYPIYYILNFLVKGSGNVISVLSSQRWAAPSLNDIVWLRRDEQVLTC
jgi:hypothetical protein